MKTPEFEWYSPTESPDTLEHPGAYGYVGILALFWNSRLGVHTAVNISWYKGEFRHLAKICEKNQSSFVAWAYYDDIYPTEMRPTVDAIHKLL